MQDIEFQWNNTFKYIDDLDDYHLLYIAYITIKKLNDKKLNERSLSINLEPLYHTMDILTYLHEIKMNGYLFKGINTNIFYLNVKKFIIDGDINATNENAKKYANILYSAINEYDINLLKNSGLCTIPFNSVCSISKK